MEMLFSEISIWGRIAIPNACLLVFDAFNITWASAVTRALNNFTRTSKVVQS